VEPRKKKIFEKNAKMLRLCTTYNYQQSKSKAGEKGEIVVIIGSFQQVSSFHQ